MTHLDRKLFILFYPRFSMALFSPEPPEEKRPPLQTYSDRPRTSIAFVFTDKEIIDWEALKKKMKENK